MWYCQVPIDPESEITMHENCNDAVGHRARLLNGMARCVADKGYAETTIADIVREASVSRRTFYEHFGDKAECLMALYVAATDEATAALRAAINPSSDWQAQVEQAMAAYLAALARNPVLLRTLFIDILGLGDVNCGESCLSAKLLAILACWFACQENQSAAMSASGVKVPKTSE